MLIIILQEILHSEDIDLNLLLNIMVEKYKNGTVGDLNLIRKSKNVEI